MLELLILSFVACRVLYGQPTGVELVALAGAFVGALARDFPGEVASGATWALGATVLYKGSRLGARFQALGPPRTLADRAERVVPCMTCMLVWVAVLSGGLSNGWLWGLAVWVAAEAIVYVVANVVWFIRDQLAH